MSRLEALNIINLGESASDDEVKERLEELIFPMKLFFLRNVPIVVVWNKRLLSLYAYEQAEIALLDPVPEPSKEEVPFDLKKYEVERSRLLLALSNSHRPSTLRMAAQAVLNWERTYEDWLLELGQTHALTLEADPPKSIDKMDSALLLAAFINEEESFFESKEFLHEYQRISKVRTIGKK